MADAGNSTIRAITPAGTVTTFAGTPSSVGSTDGSGGKALFDGPSGVAVDSSGNVFVADTENSTLREITAKGAVSTFAGTAGVSGSLDGGSSSPFSDPTGIAVDGSENVYVANSGNHVIQSITPAGAVSILAGVPNSPGSGDGPGSTAQFDGPSGVAVDSSGNVYVADFGNNTIRMITPDGVVSTLAGTAGPPGSKDGKGPAAQFSGPLGVAVDGSLNVYVADSGNDTIRMITPDGTVSTLAGTAGTAGSTDGAGNTALFDAPSGVAVDKSGNVYVADFGNSTIRVITSAKTVSTLAGSAGSTGTTDGSGSAARFSFPNGLALDASGDLYVADFGNDTLRKVTPKGTVSTPVGVAGTAKTVVGPLPASLYHPSCVAVGPTSTTLFLTVPDAVLEATF